jgi:hypothetical protein
VLVGRSLGLGQLPLGLLAHALCGVGRFRRRIANRPRFPLGQFQRRRDGLGPALPLDDQFLIGGAHDPLAGLVEGLFLEDRDLVLLGLVVGERARHRQETRLLPAARHLGPIEHLRELAELVRVARIRPRRDEVRAVLFPLPQLFAELGMGIDDEGRRGFLFDGAIGRPAANLPFYRETIEAHSTPSQVSWW